MTADNRGVRLGPLLFVKLLWSCCHIRDNVEKGYFLSCQNSVFEVLSFIMMSAKRLFCVSHWVDGFFSSLGAEAAESAGCSVTYPP